MGAKATAMDPHLHKTCSLHAASMHIQTGPTEAVPRR